MPRSSREPRRRSSDRPPAPLVASADPTTNRSLRGARSRASPWPVELEGRHLRILDQTALPARVRFRTLRTTAEAIDAIRRLQVRGAPLIGIAAAYALALAALRGEDARRTAARLKAARPTAVNLAWAVDRVLAAADPLAEACLIHAEERERCEEIARHGSKLLRRGARALTICNTGALATGGVGTAYGILRAARARIYACETRPLRQGARLTMWEAARDGLDATLLVDSAAGLLLARGGIEAVLAGADRIAANGDTANKIGTYSLAVLARRHGVPFYVAAPSSTIDPACPSGEAIPIEERDPGEVGPRAWNPAFDVTPAELVSAIVTERGVFRRPFRFAR